MITKIFFIAAVCLFGISLIEPAVVTASGREVPGIEAFYLSLRHGTAGLFQAGSASEVVLAIIVLMSAAANFVFVFWSMLVFVATRIPALRWFWWVSIVFLVAAMYTGVHAALSEQVFKLAGGYYYWLAALILMFLAPVVSRFERKHKLPATAESVV